VRQKNYNQAGAFRDTFCYSQELENPQHDN